MRRTTAATRALEAAGDPSRSSPRALRAPRLPVLAALLAAVAPSCGARTGAEGGGGAAAPERADAGLPAACVELRAAGGPFAPFGDIRAEGAHVVAREGGFDVVALVIGDVIEYRARRIEIRDGAPVLGATAVLGPEARSVAALAARGRTLTLCYGGTDLEGPTRWAQTDDLDYRTVRRSTLGDEPGDHCVALAAGPDRWLAAWQDRGVRPLDWAVAQVDDEGRIHGALHPLATPPLAATRRLGGFAWVELDASDRARAHVVLDGDDGTRSTLELAPTDGASIDALALAPAAAPAERDLELAWLDGAGRLGTLVLHPDGTRGPRTLELERAAIQDGPALATMGTRAVIAVTGCDRGLEGPGRLELLARETGSLRAHVILERPTCPTRPAIAALGGVALVAWQDADRARALLVTCEH